MQWPPPRPRPSSEPSNGDDLDPGPAQHGVGIDVAVIGHDHAGLDGDDVVAVVPLLALGLVAVAAGRDDAQMLQAERRLDHFGESAFFLDDLDSLVAGTKREGADALDHGGIDRHQVAVAEGEDRVEMHEAAVPRHERRDDAARRALLEQARAQRGDGLRRRPLAHADQHQAFGRRHHVAAFDGRAVRRLVGQGPPLLVAAGAKARMESVDRLDVQGLRPARLPVHRPDGDPAMDPTGTVAGENLVGQGRQDEIMRLQRSGRRGSRA